MPARPSMPRSSSSALRFYRDVGLDGVEVLLNSIGDAACRPAYVRADRVLPRAPRRAAADWSATGSSATRCACSIRRSRRWRRSTRARRASPTGCATPARSTSRRVRAHLDALGVGVPARARARARPRLLHAHRVRVLRRRPRGPAAGARRWRPLRRARRAARRPPDARASASGSGSTGWCWRSRRPARRPRPSRRRSRSSSAPTRPTPSCGCGSRRSCARPDWRPVPTWAAASWASSSRRPPGGRALRGHHRRRAGGGEVQLRDLPAGTQKLVARSDLAASSPGHTPRTATGRSRAGSWRRSGCPDETAEALVAAETALARRDRTWPGGLDGLLDGAFAEVGASGRAWSRDDVVAMLASDPPDRIELRDLVVERLAEDVALVRFVTVEPDPARRRARRVSVWVRRDGTWRLRYHQGTVSREAEAGTRWPNGSTSSTRRARTSPPR